MCASVEEVLKTEFNLTLGSKGVNILDPCTGTGNFIVNLIGRRIPKKDCRAFSGSSRLLMSLWCNRSANRYNHNLDDTNPSAEVFPC
jgi:hypothetical protein